VTLLNIVAVQSSAAEDIQRFLRAVFTFCSDDLEVIVATGEPAHLHSRQRLKVVEKPGAGVADLRGAGAAHATGELLAFVDASCRLYPGWEQAMRRALEERKAATGPVAYAGGWSPATWGAFLAEYGTLMPGVMRQGAVAGCNLVMRRADFLRAFAPGEAVYKPELVERLGRAGIEFGLVADAVVAHRRAARFRPFLSDRYEQGHEFARFRSGSMPAVERLLRATAFPVTWLVLTARLAVSFSARPRLRWPALIGLPVAGCYLFAWSLGEARGYLAK
jgi:hypothetical protein